MVKKWALIFALPLFSSLAAAQEENNAAPQEEAGDEWREDKPEPVDTVFGDNKIPGRPFAAIWGSMGKIGEERETMLGLRGAWMWRRDMGVGIAGKALATNNNKAIPSGTELDLTLQGITYDYTYDPMAKVHFNAVLLLGQGKVQFKDKDSGNKGSKDHFRVAEIELNGEVNLTTYLRLFAGVSKRWVNDVENSLFKDEDLEQPAAHFGMKFGEF